MLRKKGHFTLIELLAAIAIVIILAGILIGGIGYAGRRADEAKSYAVIQKVAMALEQFKQTNGYYPVSKQKNEGVKEAQLKFYLNDDKLPILQLALTGGTTIEYKFYDIKTKKSFIALEDVGNGTKDSPMVINDAWDAPLYYRCPGEHNASSYDLWSYGNDGVSSTDDDKLDDITNWEKE